MRQQAHHFVVFGATSFVGQILVRYLYQRHGIGGDVKWAIAGRSTAKLDQVRQSLGADGRKLPMIVCDASDETALRELCYTTRVVVSTVGPYALYGSPLVKVCAETGTDYCDLTGEVQWIRRMIEAHEATAKQSGARIVHCCGFDSIPSDLGVHFLQGEARKRYGAPAQRVKLRIKAMRGGVSPLKSPSSAAGWISTLMARSPQTPASRRLVQPTPMLQRLSRRLIQPTQPRMMAWHRRLAAVRRLRAVRRVPAAGRREPRCRRRWMRACQRACRWPCRPVPEQQAGGGWCPAHRPCGPLRQRCAPRPRPCGDGWRLPAG